MNKAFSLAAHTFSLSFLSVCAILVVGFYALNAAIRSKIKVGLKESLTRTEQRLDQQEADYIHRNTGVVATLGENASLKASIGLLREQLSPATRLQAEATIEDRLRELSQGLDYDLLMVTDVKGDVVAQVGAKLDDNEIHQGLSARSGGPWVARSGDQVFEVTSVPINLGAENLGKLAVGKRFALSQPGMFGQVVLFDRNGIVASSFPEAADAGVWKQLSEKCGQQKEGCEIGVGNRGYLAMGMSRDWLGPDYRLIRLASIDDAMQQITGGLGRVFISIGLGGVLIAALISLLASRSISRPLSSLASTLERSGETGALWSEFPVDSHTLEVNFVAKALNHAASARRRVEGELRSAKEAAEAATNRVELTYDDTLQALGAALDMRDNETAGHSHRVTRYCLELARSMGCSDDQLKHFERGAYLHDIGKIGVPDSILLKPGKLTPEERNIMERHPRIGYDLVSRVEFLEQAADIVLAHQERYDGTGYPGHLKADAIPFGARIFAVADTLDAMTSDRPYRKALPITAAREEIIKESGRQFDPEVVRVFETIPEKAWQRIRSQVAGLGGSIASKRAALKTTVNCTWRESRFQAASLNLSESGMLLESLGSVGVGQELELQFAIPGASEPLKPLAKIVRKEASGRIGVRFVTLTVEAREAIRRFVGSGASAPQKS